MQEEAADLVVDCRGQICPMPIFMLKEVLAGAQLGQVLEAIVGDESSRQNVLKYCWNHGQEVFRSYAESSDFHLFVRKSAEKKPENPMPAVGPCGTRWE